ncbi:MAG: NUDIX domain-containing protein [Rhodospirillaceae bacterium]|nr:NUDIX domain-containing protein [Rhodospirillaceae bacterium]
MVVWRRRRGTVEVLMGRRHRNHVFMPHAYVFPGGRVETSDGRLKPESDLPPDVQARLERAAANPTRARAIAAGAVRETWEETGLLIGILDGEVLRPNLSGLDYFFRAITPPGRTRRFDARFFLVEATGATGKLAGDGELLDLAFRTFDESRLLDVAGITRIAMAEAERHINNPPEPDPDRPVPLSRFLRGQYFITPE